jgi:hypothetical protein
MQLKSSGSAWHPAASLLAIAARQFRRFRPLSLSPQSRERKLLILADRFPKLFSLLHGLKRSQLPRVKLAIDPTPDSFPAMLRACKAHLGGMAFFGGCHRIASDIRRALGNLRLVVGAARAFFGPHFGYDESVHHTRQQQIKPAGIHLRYRLHGSHERGIKAFVENIAPLGHNRSKEQSGFVEFLGCRHFRSVHFESLPARSSKRNGPFIPVLPRRQCA